MTETEQKRPLFRPEAVEHHLRGRAPGRSLDLRERRTVWLFRTLLSVVVAGVLLAATVRVGTTAAGPVVVGRDGRTAVTEVRRAEPGAPATVTVGGRAVAARVASVAGGEVLLALDEPLPAGARGGVTIDLGRSSVLDLLLGWDD
jgi:hypothetical protein